MKKVVLFDRWTALFILVLLLISAVACVWLISMDFSWGVMVVVGFVATVLVLWLSIRAALAKSARIRSPLAY